MRSWLCLVIARSPVSQPPPPCRVIPCSNIRFEYEPQRIAFPHASLCLAASSRISVIASLTPRHLWSVFGSAPAPASFSPLDYKDKIGRSVARILGSTIVCMYSRVCTVVALQWETANSLTVYLTLWQSPGGLARAVVSLATFSLVCILKDLTSLSLFLTCGVETHVGGRASAGPGVELPSSEAASRTPGVAELGASHAVVEAEPAVIHARRPQAETSHPLPAHEESSTPASQSFHAPLLAPFVLKPNLELYLVILKQKIEKDRQLKTSVSQIWMRWDSKMLILSLLAKIFACLSSCWLAGYLYHSHRKTRFLR